MANLPEVWMRGPVAGYSAELQPVVHALLQVIEDVEAALANLSAAEIWVRPGGAASVGFHVRHIGGALDRLFTYARDEALTAEQRAALAAEGDPGVPAAEAPELLADLHAGIERALAQLRATASSDLAQPRGIGRARLPTTVLGLLFHAAEHAQRHAGQLTTTVKILRGGGTESQ
jgi:uncharacterized damage-inducible protein DinB